MTRWVGAALLLAGSSALGGWAVAQLRGRVRDLQGLTAGLEAMDRALSTSLAPLDQMLQEAEACAGQRPAQFFRSCRKRIPDLDGRPFAQLWDKALGETPLRLDDADLTVLRQLGNVLGRYDSDSQAAALEQAAQRLSLHQTEAEERQGRLGRVYGTLGVACGLFLSIMLL